MKTGNEMEVMEESLRKALDENIRNFGEIGASVSVYAKGAEIISIAIGRTRLNEGEAWTAGTLVPVFSATKGPSSACVLLALEENGLAPDTMVGQIWPEFPLPLATVGELLSHQCGLAALDESVSIEDHEAIISAVERQKPAWVPPEHGYHPRMFGPLVEELVRRLSGMTLSQFWEERIRMPLNLEFWIGLPESEFDRVARLYPGKAHAGGGKNDFYREYSTTGTLINRAFQSPSGCLSVHEMNKSDIWAGGYPALGGVGSARGLAGFYQECLADSSNSLFSREVREWMQQTRVNGKDGILMTDTAFSCGFMKDPVDHSGNKIRRLFGSSRQAFGHPGAGGSIGFADPSTGLSFAYVMNQMELGVLPGIKTSRVLEAFFQTVG